MCHIEVRNCFSCSYSPWNTSLNMLRVVVLLVLDILWTSYLKFKLNDPEVILLANHRRPRVLYFVFKRRRVEKKVDGLAYRYYCHVSLSFSKHDRRENYGYEYRRSCHIYQIPLHLSFTWCILKRYVLNFLWSQLEFSLLFRLHKTTLIFNLFY